MNPTIHLRLDEKLAILTLTRPEGPDNFLDRPRLVELRDQLAALGRQPDLRGLVIISGQPEQFCAGVDPAVYAVLTSAAEARALALLGQEILAQLAALPLPTVAAIHGPCLGGGLELALACTYRLLSDDPGTVLALPESELGLLPAFGATQRLPRLIGLKAALPLLTGQARLAPAEARRLGLADRVVPREHLLAAARRLVLAHPAAGRAGRGAWPERLAPWRAWLFFMARQAAGRRGGDHYPALAATIDAVAAGFDRDPRVGLEAAAHLLGELAISDAARHLQEVFRLRVRLARNAGAVRPYSRVAVVGAGKMGGALAGRLAEEGLQSRLLNRALPGLQQALAALRDRLADPAPVMARISYDTGLRGLRGQELVIEAVTENLGVKKSVLADIAREVPAETPVLTTTSALSIDELAQAVVHPGRVAGLHFTDPPRFRPLVEVVSGPATGEAARQAALALVRQLGLLPVAVRDSPGFLLNRLLLAYVNEALRLREGGVRIAAIERAMLDFGMELGPFALLDQIGLDRAAYLAETLHRAFGERLQPSPLLARMVAAGRLGRASGQGFYRYAGGARRRMARDLDRLLQLAPPARKGPPPAEIVDRLLLVMLNEAARCLAEGVVAEPADVDAALLFGAGFPPYTGGLLRYADDRSAVNVVKKLHELELSAGPRYAPAESLAALAGRAGRFYED